MTLVSIMRTGRLSRDILSGLLMIEGRTLALASAMKTYSDLG